MSISPNLFKVPYGASSKHFVTEIALLQEGKAIQKSLNGSLSSRRDVKDDATTARKFLQLMMEGRVRAALQILRNMIWSFES